MPDSPREVDQLEGTVTRVVFAAPDGGFAVARLEVEGRAAPVTLTGPLGDVTRGDVLRVAGSWQQHAQHGEQFVVARLIVEVPHTAEGVEKYLTTLKGIGPQLAARLVERFGVAAVEVVEKEPWRTAQIKGVGKRRAGALAEEAARRRSERETLIFLQGLGIPTALAQRIRKTYGADVVARVQRDPYRLARDIPGVGFPTADRIAARLGVDPQAPERLAAGVAHALEERVQEGDVYAVADEILPRAAELLGSDVQLAAAGLERLILEGAVLREDDALYLPRLHRAEVQSAQSVAELLAAPRLPPPILKDLAQADDGPLLAKGQEQALEVARHSGVVVITGGPGTGKTTIVRRLAALYAAAGRRVLLAAPTGRAARRLSEATGRPASTIHRLLGWGRGERAGPSVEQLACELLVVDEVSMLDIQLARALFAAVPRGATLALVGDIDQLPSVGPGFVLRAIIESGVVPTVRLTEVFRQAEGSGIIDNAYRILRGDSPVGATFTAGGKGDFFVAHAATPEAARDLIARLCAERIPRAFGLDPRRDVQVLAPMHRGAAGTEELNRVLQARLNPATTPRGSGPLGRFSPGDKVIQLRNDYTHDIFNGDVGHVLRIDEENAAIVVDFDGREVAVDAEAAGDLDLAYAISVHKSQGSEYPAVVMPVVGQHAILLRRNLLYTAVTRGKRLVVLVGQEAAIARAVRSAEAERRRTRLAFRLRELAPVIK